MTRSSPSLILTTRRIWNNGSLIDCMAYEIHLTSRLNCSNSAYQLETGRLCHLTGRGYKVHLDQLAAASFQSTALLIECIEASADQ